MAKSVFCFLIEQNEGQWELQKSLSLAFSSFFVLHLLAWFNSKKKWGMHRVVRENRVKPSFWKCGCWRQEKRWWTNKNNTQTLPDCSDTLREPSNMRSHWANQMPVEEYGKAKRLFRKRSQCHFPITAWGLNRSQWMYCQRPTPTISGGQWRLQKEVRVYILNLMHTSGTFFTHTVIFIM